jgi:uncharacterized protein (TIGR02284 family)
MRGTTHTENIVEALTNLAQSNRDSEEGYSEAAESVRDSDSELHTLLHKNAQQRARFAGELEQEVRTYGGEYPIEGTLGGTLRKGWLNLRSALSGGDASAILDECINSDEGALEDYRDTLQQDLPDYLKEMIRQQHDEIMETVQHLRALKQTYSR